MKDFSEFLKHDDEVVRRVAGVLRELSESLDLKSISQEEYDELVGDLLDMNKIDNFATSIEHKAKLEKAFNALSAIVGSVV